MAHDGLIRSKFQVPTIGADVIGRPRLQRALESAADGRRILLVVASAGSGKTTAVVQFLASRPGPRAWLTLGGRRRQPRAPPDLPAAAASSIDPEAAERVRRFLADGLSPEDCAAILGESLPPARPLVIDDVHHLEARASVLSGAARPPRHGRPRHRSSSWSPAAWCTST